MVASWVPAFMSETWFVLLLLGLLCLLLFSVLLMALGGLYLLCRQQRAEKARRLTADED
jgi:hypothetical protein